MNLTGALLVRRADRAAPPVPDKAPAVNRLAYLRFAFVARYYSWQSYRRRVPESALRLLLACDAYRCCRKTPLRSRRTQFTNIYGVHSTSTALNAALCVMRGLRDEVNAEPIVKAGQTLRSYRFLLNLRAGQVSLHYLKRVASRLRISSVSAGSGCRRP